MSKVDYTEDDFKNGLKCEWMGKKCVDMTNSELIAFIGMLDGLLTETREEVGE